MFRVRLLHWRASEAEDTIAILRAAGFRVEYDEKFTPLLMRQWRENPPRAFVIDLTRLPSQGMEIAIALRQSPRTRHVPIAFCEGRPDKIEKIRTILPDASFCNRDTLAQTLQNAKSTVATVQPTPMMDRYGARTAAQKLGISPGSKVVLMDAPASLIAGLGQLPEGVEFIEEGGSVILCCVHSLDGLRSTLSNVRRLAGKTRLWILWQKKKAPGHSGITEPLIRQTGVDVGLVDYKICSVNDTWSAMLFATKRANQVS